MEEVFRLILLTLLLAAVASATPVPAHAATDLENEGEISGALLLPVAAVAHFKYGLHLSVAVKKKNPWSLWLLADLGVNSFATVNPGATSLPDDPTMGETHTGAQPAIFRVLAITPWRKNALSFVTGLTWLYLDLKDKTAASIPNAPTIALKWKDPSNKKIEMETYVGLSLNPFGSRAILILPEFRATRRFLGNAGVCFGVRVPVYRSFADEGSTGVLPSFSVGLTFGG